MQSRHNVCAERTLEAAFQRVLGRDITFRETAHDAQIDLGPAFMATEGESKSWLSGHHKGFLEADFAALDQKKTYFMRTGLADGAGHWQLLYFEADGWHGFSTMSNQKHYTRDGHLTKDGEGLMTHKDSAARWGLGSGQYSILIQEANEARIIAAANFVRDVRLLGEYEAMERVFDPSFNSVLNTTGGHIVETPRPTLVVAPAAVDYQSMLDGALSNFSSVIDKTASVLTSDITGGKAFYLDAIQQYAEAHPDEARVFYEETLTKLYMMSELAGISTQGMGAIEALSADVSGLLAGLSARAGLK